MANQVHKNSINLGLNFKPYSLKTSNLSLKSSIPGLKENKHCTSSNYVLNFQMGVSTSQVHTNSLNPSLKFKPQFGKLYEGCPLISAIGFVTRKSALSPESEH